MAGADVTGAVPHHGGELAEGHDHLEHADVDSIGLIGQATCVGRGVSEAPTLKFDVVPGQREGCTIGITHEIGITTHGQQHVGCSTPVSFGSGTPKRSDRNLHRRVPLIETKLIDNVGRGTFGHDNIGVAGEFGDQCWIIGLHPPFARVEVQIEGGRTDPAERRVGRFDSHDFCTALDKQTTAITGGETADLENTIHGSILSQMGYDFVDEPPRTSSFDVHAGACQCHECKPVAADAWQHADATPRAWNQPERYFG